MTDITRKLLSLEPGIYQGLHVIGGAPFRISFWTRATDISMDQARERLEFANTLIARWNAFEEVSDPSAVIKEARFLVDRLKELDWAQGVKGFERDFSGHVVPSLERLNALLVKLDGAS